MRRAFVVCACLAVLAAHCAAVAISPEHVEQHLEEYVRLLKSQKGAKAHKLSKEVAGLLPLVKDLQDAEQSKLDLEQETETNAKSDDPINQAHAFLAQATEKVKALKLTGEDRDSMENNLAHMKSDVEMMESTASKEALKDLLQAVVMRKEKVDSFAPSTPDKSVVSEVVGTVKGQLQRLEKSDIAKTKAGKKEIAHIRRNLQDLLKADTSEQRDDLTHSMETSLEKLRDLYTSSQSHQDEEGDDADEAERALEEEEGQPRFEVDEDALADAAEAQFSFLNDIHEDDLADAAVFRASTRTGVDLEQDFDLDEEEEVNEGEDEPVENGAAKEAEAEGAAGLEEEEEDATRVLGEIDEDALADAAEQAQLSASFEGEIDEDALADAAEAAEQARVSASLEGEIDEDALADAAEAAEQAQLEGEIDEDALADAAEYEAEERAQGAASFEVDLEQDYNPSTEIDEDALADAAEVEMSPLSDIDEDALAESAKLDAEEKDEDDEDAAEAVEAVDEDKSVEQEEEQDIEEQDVEEQDEDEEVDE